MLDVRERAGGGQVTCPLCRQTVDGAAADQASCRGCDTRYHEACLAELGGCATLGCSLQGVAVGVARSLGCGVCGRLAAEPLTRRRCGCGATVHQACVDAHAARCERGRRLQPDAAGPRPAPTSEHRAPSPSPSRLVPLAVAVVLQLLGGALWGVALAEASVPDASALVLLIAVLVTRVHEVAADLSWFDAEDLPVLVVTLALLVPGLGIVLWWAARAAERRQ